MERSEEGEGGIRIALPPISTSETACFYCKREKCLCPTKYGRRPEYHHLLLIVRLAAEMMCWTPELSPTNEIGARYMNLLTDELEKAGYNVG